MFKKNLTFICMFFLFFEIGLQLASLIAKINFTDLTQSADKKLIQKNTINIMTLGESTTAWGGKFSYPSVLERILNEKYPNRFKVYNVGQASINSSIVLARLPGLIKKNKPDVAVLMIGINDYWSLPDYHLSESRRILQFLSKYLRTFRLIEIGIVNFSSDRIDKNNLESESKCLPSPALVASITNKANREKLENIKRLSQNLGLNELKRQLIQEIIATKDIEVARYSAILLENKFGLLDNKKIYEAVGEVCNEGLKYSQNDIGCGEYYARFLIRSGFIEQAQQILEKIVRRNPPALHSYLELGSIYKEKKDYELSIKTYELGIKNLNVKGYCTDSYFFQERILNILLGDLNNATRANVAVDKMLKEDILPARRNQLLSHKNRIRRILHLPATNEHLVSAKNYWENSSYKLNIQQIIKQLKKNNIKVIVMQYPRLPIGPLAELMGDKKDIEFLENLDNFELYLKTHKYEEAFEDNFGEIFGHFTKDGAELIAKQLAIKILNL